MTHTIMSGHSTSTMTPLAGDYFFPAISALSSLLEDPVVTQVVASNL